MKLNTLKIIVPLTLLAASQSLMAHPGPPGHSHDGTEDWPFPDFSWPMVIAGLSIGAIALAVYYYQKSQSE
ncbi:hypothetical protein ACFPK9_07535 [Rubritalea spongiae]|uniref:Uncharacterized protein n=1 Tax=Rubritalea spongiae TaxID=430797 RepID=A0ABW5E0Y0_9BACT